ncbi:hypothetical protein [Spongiimicrobium sp. 3-5]|uniref:hypothetical protein n=1 Tax=Spongiimicrobium sp. 3-5 TaxID=3332596 RepID=UPI00398164C7
MTDTEKRVRYCNDLGLAMDEVLKIMKQGIPREKELEISLLQQHIDELRKDSGIGLLEFMETYIEERKIQRLSVQGYEQTWTQVHYYIGPGNGIRLNSISPGKVWDACSAKLVSLA